VLRRGRRGKGRAGRSDLFPASWFGVLDEVGACIGLGLFGYVERSFLCHEIPPLFLTSRHEDVDAMK
jgi:hypothetical protein